tara:strand:- start:121204 stop:123120 length:1917 start_codon:yes stop_codon:yes gene_type:complete
MKHLLTILLSFIIFHNFGQQLFYQDVLYGGVTGAGFSTGAASDTTYNIIQIPAGSSIKKAYLIAAVHGTPPPTHIILNGKNYIFNSTNIITTGFTSINTSNLTFVNSSTQAIDITNDIDSSITSYEMIISQQYQNGSYAAFYLYIVFENPLFSKITCNLFLNIQNVSPYNIYNIFGLNSINNIKPVGLGLIISDFCSTTFVQDGSYIYINDSLIGLIGGPDSNSSTWHCAATYANFAHYNDTLYGLSDDTPDSLMNKADVLADIKSYVNYGDTTIKISLIEQSLFGRYTNPLWALMLSYYTPCDTFSTSAYAVQDTICYGDSVQLFASGGVQYSWYGAFGGLSDSAVANPMASPPQTTTYICTITNDSGCVKTEHVKVYVIPPVDSIKVKPTLCGEQTGKITAEFNGNYTFTLLDSNNQTVASNTTGIFSQLPQGTYILQSQNQQCTYYDTLTVGYVNQTVASFWRNPYQGKAPLTVEFGNQSQIATDFVWLFPNDTFYTPNLTYTFDTGGVYPVCLVAYNNYPHCSDTACYTFFVEENALLEVPNVFSPNGDGKNDFFTLQFFDAAGISAIQVDIFNRWGQTVHQFSWQNTPPAHLNVWNGTNANGEKLPEGTYFYTITYNLNGKPLNQKGSVTLVR